jgi:hypothetical protein
MRIAFAFFAVSLTLAGCGGTIVVNGIKVPERRWNDTQDDLGPRAALELDCQRETLEFILTDTWHRIPRETAVQGCGRRALYQRPVTGMGLEEELGSWELAGPVITLEAPAAETPAAETPAAETPAAEAPAAEEGL